MSLITTRILPPTPILLVDDVHLGLLDSYRNRCGGQNDISLSSRYHPLLSQGLRGNAFPRGPVPKGFPDRDLRGQVYWGAWERGGEGGFTLIELLIALAIGAIVLLAAYNVFVSQQKSHKLQSELVDAEQNARAALDLLTREIRLAGAGVQRTILTGNITGGTTTTLNVISSTGFSNEEIINIAAPGKADAVALNAAPGSPYTSLSLSSAPTNSYTIASEDVSIFKEKITGATRNSITFRAPITTKETALYRGAVSGDTAKKLYISNQTNTDFEKQSDTTSIFINDGGGRFENPNVAANGGSASCTCTDCSSDSDCDTLTLTGTLINSYPIGSKVNTGVDTIAYAFDSANNQITRNNQPFAENIDYFQIKYYDESNNSLLPDPDTGLDATQRAKIRKVTIQIVAISSKDDMSHTESGNYGDGTSYYPYVSYAASGSTNRRRIFLESDILLTNMVP